jgi:hypothetical protein
MGPSSVTNAGALVAAKVTGAETDPMTMSWRDLVSPAVISIRAEPPPSPELAAEVTSSLSDGAQIQMRTRWLRRSSAGKRVSWFPSDMSRKIAVEKPAHRSACGPPMMAQMFTAIRGPAALAMIVRELEDRFRSAAVVAHQPLRRHF